MDIGLALAIALALAFAVTNGLLDASNAIATLVATRGARPGQAIVLASVFNLLGPFLVGAAVADTIGGIVTVSPAERTPTSRFDPAGKRPTGPLRAAKIPLLGSESAALHGKQHLRSVVEAPP